jgi:FkbM family methyltransferase
MRIKLSLSEDIFRFNDIKVFVPNYPIEAIQNYIVTNKNFYENAILQFLDKYIQPNSRILDIGSNIGNHSLYWATRSKASKIIAFEPIIETYNILVKNIDINNLSNVITAKNIALGNEKGFASINTFNFENHGATSLKESVNGQIKVETLDGIINDSEQFNFVKIDVEGFEEQVLKGGRKTFLKNKPYLFIEIQKENYISVSNLLFSFNAKLIHQFDEYNFLYKFI